MRPPERTRIRVSPGAPALLAVFVWLSSPEVLGAVLLAALCHELGHYAALRRRGGWVRAVRISALGAEMQVAGRMSYGGELLAAAAGPAVNLVLAAALAGLFGILALLGLAIWYLCTIDSDGVAYMAPFVDSERPAIFRTLLRRPQPDEKFRPPEYGSPNRRRQR